LRSQLTIAAKPARVLSRVQLEHDGSCAMICSQAVWSEATQSKA
jgi:hypothetical protein